jgi:hypothetical protein
MANVVQTKNLDTMKPAPATGVSYVRPPSTTPEAANAAAAKIAGGALFTEGKNLAIDMYNWLNEGITNRGWETYAERVAKNPIESAKSAIGTTGKILNAFGTGFGHDVKADWRRGLQTLLHHPLSTFLTVQGGVAGAKALAALPEMAAPYVGYAASRLGEAGSAIADTAYGMRNGSWADALGVGRSELRGIVNKWNALTPEEQQSFRILAQERGMGSSADNIANDFDGIAQMIGKDYKYLGPKDGLEFQRLMQEKQRLMNLLQQQLRDKTGTWSGLSPEELRIKKILDTPVEKLPLTDAEEAYIRAKELEAQQRLYHMQRELERLDPNYRDPYADEPPANMYDDSDYDGYGEFDDDTDGPGAATFDNPVYDPNYIPPLERDLRSGDVIDRLRSTFQMPRHLFSDEQVIEYSQAYKQFHDEMYGSGSYIPSEMADPTSFFFKGQRPWEEDAGSMDFLQAPDTFGGQMGGGTPEEVIGRLRRELEAWQQKMYGVDMPSPGSSNFVEMNPNETLPGATLRGGYGIGEDAWVNAQKHGWLWKTLMDAMRSGEMTPYDFMMPDSGPQGIREMLMKQFSDAIEGTDAFFLEDAFGGNNVVGNDMLQAGAEPEALANSAYTQYHMHADDPGVHFAVPSSADPSGQHFPSVPYVDGGLPLPMLLQAVKDSGWDMGMLTQRPDWVQVLTELAHKVRPEDMNALMKMVEDYHWVNDVDPSGLMQEPSVFKWNRRTFPWM